MEIQINYQQTACGITYCNKNPVIWKRLHLKKCVICAGAKADSCNIQPDNISAKAHVNTFLNQYGKNIKKIEI
jgi:hypothetical protein